MNLEYKDFIPATFPDNSRVWIYQANRLLTVNECLHIQPIINQFVENWKAHNIPVKGWCNLIFGQFLVLMADENVQMVSGCSTDSSVHFVKEIQEALHVDFFNRQLLAFIKNEKIETIPLSQVEYAFEHKLLLPETLYFNNLVATKAEFLNHWIIPAKDSWLAKQFL